MSLKRFFMFTILKKSIIGIENSKFYRSAIDPVRAIYRKYGFADGIRLLSYLVRCKLTLILKKPVKNIYSIEQVKENRKSDTVFVFGTGYSLHELSEAEWELINQNDVISLNYFVHQEWADVTIHQVRELRNEEENQTGHFRSQFIRNCVRHFETLVVRNPRYKNAIFFLQNDFYATIGRSIQTEGNIPKSNPICLYQDFRNVDLEQGPVDKLDQGITRLAGAIGGGITIANIVGWKKIVLAGVDLYDARHFYLDPDEVENKRIVNGERVVKDASSNHPTFNRGIVDIMKAWHNNLADKEVSLEVYNPKSLLTEVLPVFEWANGQTNHEKYSK